MENSHIPRKRFGQHFLIDQAIIKQIVDYIRPQSDQIFCEIGPGLGAITLPLIDKVAQLIAIEIDRDLAAKLTEQLRDVTNFSLIEQDVLRVDLTSVFPTKEKVRVVGNLPYNISTPLLFKLFELMPLIQDMHFMLQKEVAMRLVAIPGTKDYGRLSVMAQYHCAMYNVLDVAADAFDPAPSVASHVVRFMPHKKPDYAVANYEQFTQIVGLAFCQRRKNIANAIKKACSVDKLHSLGIEPNRRADELSVTDFVNLSNSIT